MRGSGSSRWLLAASNLHRLQVRAQLRSLDDPQQGVLVRQLAAALALLPERVARIHRGDFAGSTIVAVIPLPDLLANSDELLEDALYITHGHELAEELSAAQGSEVPPADCTKGLLVYQIVGTHGRMMRGTILVSDIRTCEQCQLRGMGYQRCSRCKTVYYCGTECQRAHWSQHKNGCSH